MNNKTDPKQFWRRHCCMGCLTMSLRDALIDKGFLSDRKTHDVRVTAVDRQVAKAFGFDKIEDLDRSVIDCEDIVKGQVSGLALRVQSLRENPHVLTLFKMIQAQT